MKLLRHLLSHIILILVLFGIVSLYYYRHLVLPDTYAEKIDIYSDKIHPKLKSFARIKKVKEDTSTVEVAIKENVEVVEPKADEDKAIVNKSSDNAIAEQKVDSAVKVEVEASIITNDAVEKDITEKVVAENEVVKVDNEKPVVEAVPLNKSDKETEKSSIDEIEQITKTNGSPDSDKEAASANDLLRAARLAFNHGDLKGSVDKYNLLIELENDEADFYGELGNVYYAMGYWENAGIAYYEAATRLIEERKHYQVHYLQRDIHVLDAERAEKLANQLASLKN